MTTDGTPSDDRLPLAASGTSSNPHEHLDSVVDAELRWGNKIQTDWWPDKVGGWHLVLAHPFHIDLLRRTFSFPPTFTLSPSGPRLDQLVRMSLSDPEFVEITAPCRRTGPGAPIPSTLARSRERNDESLPGGQLVEGVSHFVAVTGTANLVVMTVQWSDFALSADLAAHATMIAESLEFVPL